ncbi:SDR family oxidoreductase [Microtetraspora sp. NBRC 16547]|uniref:SDR family NAD(P)-dependent oxidoreductase n=1 Tax=Microtetraspora sp. NBRC 16547 TaxID=3030993 RepID=UPI0024A22017|nr:SDR family oxidoreductase [Microtetraspora sp. NBRC 16547]GLW99319.1 beta-ketoacyl-ACP reductase [Microtetraspora sp. NBRC 16547]
MTSDPRRTVLVAGALGGLASQVVTEVIEEGHSVVACDRLDAPSGDWTRSVAGSAADRLRFHQVDATDEDAVTAFADELRAEGVHVDAVVNTVGMQHISDVAELKTKYWRRVLSVNLDSTFFLTRAFITPMREAKWGRIVTFASVYAYQPTFGQAAYAAAKAGVIGFTRSVALDAAVDGVTINAVAPAVVWHERLSGALPDEHWQQLRERIPQGEFGDPRHVAATVRYLLSEGGGHTTGQTIHVNGGMYPGG